MKHTPAPWIKEGGRSDLYITCPNGDKIIAEIPDYFNPTLKGDIFPQEEVMANAALIAAAPELLEALSRIASVQRGGITAADDKDYIIDLAIEAIAKAKGK